MSALKIRVCAIIALAAAADYSTKKGYLVTHDGTTQTITGIVGKAGDRTISSPVPVFANTMLGKLVTRFVTGVFP